MTLAERRAWRESNGGRMPQRVELDAMIPRGDFALTDDDKFQTELLPAFHISNLQSGSQILRLLRKPDFQRETNHWSPDQVVSLIQSYAEGTVIPGLIFWRGINHIFVLDGGHRLSALRAWIEDDYGDGVISLQFYGNDISKLQKRTAARTRVMVEKAVGRYSALSAQTGLATAPEDIKRKTNIVFSRSMVLQWVQGTPDMAEASFFKINTQGTPLDETEEMLIKQRLKPIAISARAILRAGKGNRYWSAFDPAAANAIESAALKFHETVFQPEATVPVKTLDLPVGGSKSPVDALGLLVSFLEISGNRSVEPQTIKDDPDDTTGAATLEVLKKAFQVITRIAGNDAPSLGLHPAVYFYNEKGKFSRFLFLGFAAAVTDALRSNNKKFFFDFTLARKDLETFLIQHKQLLGFALQNMARGQRIPKIKALFQNLVRDINTGQIPTAIDVLERIGVSGDIVTLRSMAAGAEISDDTKSALFINAAIQSAIRCPECDGLIDVAKSVSYDHDATVRDGGTGGQANVRLTHPYCNTGFKEHKAAEARKAKEKG